MRDSATFATIGLLALFLLASPLGATSFDLARVADLNTAIPAGTGNFTALLFPAVSGGNVAFLGFGSFGQRGIYLFAGGTLSRVADQNTAVPAGTGTFTSFGAPALSGDLLAFHGNRGPEEEGVYLFAGGTLSRVADVNTPIPDGNGTFGRFRGNPALSGVNIAFLGFGSSFQEGIYHFAGKLPLTRVADLNTAIPGGTGNFIAFDVPVLSGSNVAFLGFGSSGQRGIYLLAGATLSRVVDLNTAIPGGTGNFTGLSNFPMLSGKNVTFRGVGSGQEGIYVFAGGALSRVADLNTAIPGGASHFTGFNNFPVVSGGNVAFLGGGSSGQQGIYLLARAPLTRVADRNTVLADGTVYFTSFFDPAVSGGNVAFRGRGTSGQDGIYLFAGSTLSRVADRNTAIPGGTGAFTGFDGLPVLSGRNVALRGGGSAGQGGIYLAAPAPGLIEFQGSGRAQNVGLESDNGNVRIRGKFTMPDALALDRATLMLTDVLNEVDVAGELAGGIPVILRARTGSKPTDAVYQTASGARPHVTVEIKRRDPRSPAAEFTITVDRDRIAAPSGCAGSPTASTQLVTSFELQANASVVPVGTILSWRCLRG